MHPFASGPGSVGLDEIVFRALNLAGTNAVTDLVMITVTTLGAAYIIAFLAVPLWWRGHREATYDLLLLLGVTILVTEAIKFAVGRPRPCDNVVPNVRTLAGFGCDVELDPSFPSGHASRAFAVAAFVAVRFRWKAGVAGTAFAVVVGVSRVYLGVHWPSDVVAGALLGIALALLVEVIARKSAVYRRVRSRLLSAIPHRPTRPAP